jgi:hypothetical protein
VTITLRRISLLVSIVLGCLSLYGCSQASPSALTPTLAEATAPPLPTDTPAPSPTPTPEAPVAILLAPADADPATSAALQGALTRLAGQAGLGFEVRAELNAADLGNVRIVVALPPASGLAELAASAPETQFLAFGIQGLQPTPNLSAIASPAGRPDQLGFVAGYLAAVITEDWRVGVVSEAGTTPGKAASLGFRNGMTYFCGLCLPVYPPFPNRGYPVQVELTEEAGAEDWQAAIDALTTWQVETVFVYPSVADEQLLADLAGAGINIIVASPTSEPPNAWHEHWVASLGSQDPLQSLPDLWAKLLAGKGGEEVLLPLGFTGTNPDLLSPGRQHLVEAMLADLLSGFIDTGVDPQTGESR